MAITVSYRIKFAYKTAAEWTAENPVLLAGETGIESDVLGKPRKLGDGVTAWSALQYDGGLGAALTALNSLTPAADYVPYFTGPTTAALASFTPFGRSLVDDADAAAGRATLGLDSMAVQPTGSYVPKSGGTFTGTVQVSTTAANLSAFEAINPDPLGYGEYVRGGSASRFTAKFADYTGADLFVIRGDGLVYPGSDNTQNFGHPSFRWATVYAGTGAINTSDRRAKRDIGAVPDQWLDAWADVEWCRFKFKDGQRWHVGLVAQQVRDAFAAHGLNACEIGLIGFDAWEAEPAVRAKHDRRGRLIRRAEPARKAGNRWGLRYDECDAMEHALDRRERDQMRREIARLAALIAA